MQKDAGCFQQMKWRPAWFRQTAGGSEEVSPRWGAAREAVPGAQRRRPGERWPSMATGRGGEEDGNSPWRNATRWASEGAETRPRSTGRRGVGATPAGSPSITAGGLSPCTPANPRPQPGLRRPGSRPSSAEHSQT